MTACLQDRSDDWEVNVSGNAGLALPTVQSPARFTFEGRPPLHERVQSAIGYLLTLPGEELDALLAELGCPDAASLMPNRPKPRSGKRKHLKTRRAYRPVSGSGSG